MTDISNRYCTEEKTFDLDIKHRQPLWIGLECSDIGLTAECEYRTPLPILLEQSKRSIRGMGQRSFFSNSGPIRTDSAPTQRIACELDVGPPRGDGFVMMLKRFPVPGAVCSVTFRKSPTCPPDKTWTFPQPISSQNSMPKDYSTHLVVDLHGYTPTPQACENDDGARANAMVIKNCAAHYPDHNNYGAGGNVPMGWWGIFEGTNSNGFRISESIVRAFEKYTQSIDWGRGITLQGTSYGGTGAILQSMLLPNEVSRRFISVVHANLPHTMFVKKDPNPHDGIDERGHYYRDPAVQWAWGDFDTSKADFAVAAAEGRVDRIYYRVNGGTNDSLGIVDLDFFRICDQYKIACFGTWHQAGHEIAEPGINLPFNALYNSPEQDVRFDQVLPVFTQSTANNWGERGHYNLGLSWNSSEMEVSADGIFRSDSLSPPHQHRTATRPAIAGYFQYHASQAPMAQCEGGGRAVRPSLGASVISQAQSL